MQLHKSNKPTKYPISDLKFNGQKSIVLYSLFLHLILTMCAHRVEGNNSTSSSNSTEQKGSPTQQLQQLVASSQPSFDSNEVQIIELDPKNHRRPMKSQPMKNLNKFKEIRTKLRNKCLSSEVELDRCSAELIGFGSPSMSDSGSQSGNISQQQQQFLLPDNMQDLNSVYCPKFKETSSCIKNVTTDCYKPFERQIINWVLSSTRRMNHKRCKDEGEKQRFLRLTNSCLAPTMMMMTTNAKQTDHQQHQQVDCMSHYIGSLDAIAEFDEHVERLSEQDVQIQLACCANKRFKQCVMDQAKSACKQSLRDNNEKLKQKLRRTNSNSAQRQARKQIQRNLLNTMDDLKNTLDGMALTGPEFICMHVDEKFCQLKFDGKFTNRRPRHRSILPAMIKIYANK